MHKFIYSQKDAWISELTSSENHGNDEILEFRKDFKTADSSSYTYGVTRVLAQFDINDISIDKQLIDRIFKFASIKHILNNNQNDHEKIFDLLQEIERDLKNYELELRIEELESKFAKDLSESTFEKIKELKKLKNIN